MSDQATLAKRCLANTLAAIEEIEAELARLDAVAGDGDHGAGMVRGLRAAHEAAQTSDSPSANQIIAAAGTAFTNTAGGASGALFGMFIATVGQNLAETPDAANLHQAVKAGVDIVCKLGKTKPGDKTMVDTLAPFVDALEQAAEQGLSPVEAWRQALPAAQQGMEATAEMVSKRGRASRLGERSRGSMDPGAVSMYTILRTVGETLAP